MWRQIYEFGKQLFTLTERTEQNQQNIKALRHEMEEMSATMRELYFEIQRLRSDVGHEQEKTLLKLENALLKFRLPHNEE